MESNKKLRIKWDLEDLNSLKNLMNIIEDIKKDTNESVKIFDSDQKLYNDLNKYMNEERKIYISMFGEYSTGKTSLINDLIGENIFETSFNVNTNKGILIQNSDKKNFYKLEKIQFIKNEDNYYYFKQFDNNNEKNVIIEGKENIIKKLKEINNEENKKIEECFYLITLNIKILKKIDKNYRNKIVFIDFPGLGVNENLNEKNNFFDTDVFPELIKQVDCFLFLNKNLFCESDFNKIFFKRLDSKFSINNIENSFNNIIFIMTFWDKNSNNKPRTEEDLIEIKKNYEKMLNKKNLCVIKYSHQYYKYYKEEKKKINSYQNYSNQKEQEKNKCIFNNYYNMYNNNDNEEEEEEEEKGNEQNEKDFNFEKDNFIEFMSEKINENKKKLLIKKDKNFKINENEKKKIEKFLIDFLKEKELKNITKFSFNKFTNLFLKYKHNYKLYSKYKNYSNCKETFDKIKKLISEANYKMEEEIKNKYDEFLYKFFNKISFIKNKINRIKKNNETEKIENSCKNINELFNDCYSKNAKKIIFKNDNFGNIFNKYKEKIINYINKFDINENIKKHNKNIIDEIISEIQENLFNIENEFEKLLEEKYLFIKNSVLEEVKKFGLEFVFNRNKIEIKKKSDKIKNINQNYAHSILRKILKIFYSDNELIKSDIRNILNNLKLEYNIYFREYEVFYKNEISILQKNTNNYFKEIKNINKLQINNLIKNKINIIDALKDEFEYYLIQKYKNEKNNNTIK